MMVTLGFKVWDLAQPFTDAEIEGLTGDIQLAEVPTTPIVSMLVAPESMKIDTCISEGPREGSE